MTEQAKQTITLPNAPQPTRVEAEKAQRRRRGDTSETRNLKLSVPKSLLDPKFEYRWINDKSNGRLQDKTVNDDWNIVQTLDADKKDVPVTRNVGNGEHGQPMRAYLCRKPKEFYEEDQAANLKAIEEREKGLRRGVTDPGKGGLSPTEYVPGGSNTIERGR